MKNGGIIGVPNLPTTSEASGVWGLREQLRAQRDGIWPVRGLLSSYSFIDFYPNENSLTSYSVTTSVSAGLVIVTAHNETPGTDPTTAYPVASMSIGGVSASKAVEASISGATGPTHTSIWYAVTTSSTTNITVNYNNAPIRAGIGVYHIPEFPAYKSSIPIQTYSDSDTSTPISRTINTTTIPENCFILGVSTCGNPLTTTWTDLTENYDTELANTGSSGAALITTTSRTHTITATQSSTPTQTSGLVVAVWN